MAGTPARSRADNQPTSNDGKRSLADLASVQDRLGLWPLRIAWLFVPLVLGRAIGGELGRFAEPGPLVGEILLWLVWFLGLVATLVPTAASLTTIRILAPAVIGLTVGSALVIGTWSAESTAALFYGLVLSLLALLPIVGDRMINGGAYGSERRMALRPPAFTLLGPIQLAWLLVFVGATAGPWLLLAGRIGWGLAAVVVGIACCWLGVRILHQLARRWIVFVPAGFVIHDHTLAVESILLRRSSIDGLGPATGPTGPSEPTGPTGTTAAEETTGEGLAAEPAADVVDLSGGAYGLALQVAVDEPVMFGRRRRGVVTNTEARRLVFTPTLPGQVLAEARIRAIRIGSVRP